MKFLTVSALLYSIHHNVLGCHKRNLCHKMLVDNLRIYNQTIHNV